MFAVDRYDPTGGGNASSRGKTNNNNNYKGPRKRHRTTSSQQRGRGGIRTKDHGGGTEDAPEEEEGSQHPPTSPDVKDKTASPEGTLPATTTTMTTTTTTGRLRVIAPEQPDPLSLVLTSSGLTASRRRRKRRRRGGRQQGDDDNNGPPSLSDNGGAVTTATRLLSHKTAAEAMDDLDLDPITVIEPIDGGGEGTGLDATEQRDATLTRPLRTATIPTATTTAGVFVTAHDLERAHAVSQQSLVNVAQQWKLADFLLHNLKAQHWEHFFPIQAVAIPHLLLSSRTGMGGGGGLYGCRDVCLAAPTGSGKTLSYVLPVLQALHETPPPHVPHLLRALVVLPSRDLARQVHQVMTDYIQGSDLTVGLAVGQSDFPAEQRVLWGGHGTDGTRSLDCMDWDDPVEVQLARRRLTLDPSNVSLALNAYDNCLDHAAYEMATRSVHAGCRSSVDVLVCTPGRLVDHLERGTFTLRHLRYLVVDEADRLLSQRYHDWIPKVLAAAEGTDTVDDPHAASYDDNDDDVVRGDRHADFLEPKTWRLSETIADRRFGPAAVPLQKILVSATLTRDPQKLAALQVHHPLHLHLHPNDGSGGSGTAGGLAEKRYALPPRLDEGAVECTAEQKPLALLALLLERLDAAKVESDNDGKVVVFTSSVDSTHRLTRLLQLMWLAGAADSWGPQSPSILTSHQNPVAEFSSTTSSLPASERAALLRDCRVVVCSDGMSRGMDLSDVRCVINYDVPTLAKTYVHRCGRTARAGHSGAAVTLLKLGQVAQFRRMRSLIVPADAVRSLPLPNTAQLQRLAPTYRSCLTAMRHVLEAEEAGELGPADVDQLSVYLNIEARM